MILKILDSAFRFRLSALFTALLAALILASLGGVLRADEPRSAGDWLKAFTSQWDESAWLPKGRRQYMRPLDDRGWQTRMRAMQALVAGGDESLALLLKALADDDTPTRILAAQTLSYLAPRVPQEILLKAAANDSDAAVRLYAIDALGMQGRDDLSERLASLRMKETNRDAKKHLGYALERTSHAVDNELVRSLVEWDAARINSAAIGQLAPDFQLKTVAGKAVRLSQFRGDSAVVLVFIYGDT